MNTISTHICTTILTCIQDGFFSLSNASQEGYDEIVQMLLQAGATVDLQNKVENWFSCHLWCSMCSIHNIYGKGRPKHMSNTQVVYDIFEATKSLVHWKHEHLWGLYIWACFPKKFGLGKQKKTPVIFYCEPWANFMCNLPSLATSSNSQNPHHQKW